MASPSRSLNSLVSWSRLLPTLGVEDIRTTILPATTPCPLCGGDRLRVYDDPVVGGQWGNCESCHFAGDMVELAAKAWDLDAAAALMRLAARGVVEGDLPAERIEGYVRDHVQYRKRLNVFWEAARQRPRRNVPRAVSHLLRKFGVLELAGSPAWPYHAGQVIGSAHRREIEDLFHPGSYAVRPRSNGRGKPSARRGPGPGHRQLFRGDGWEDVLVVAFCDLPGRVSGLLCVGREADPEAGDIIFKAANYRPSCRGFQEAGLGLWQALERGTHPQLGNTLFVIAEPMVALRLQLRHLRAGTVPLPIVMSWHSPGAQTEAALANLAGRELVFWGPNPYVLRQARSVDGLVSTYIISQQEIARTLCHRPPLGWLWMIKQDAMPWRVATYHALRQGNQSSTEATLREMQFSPTEMRDFVNGCPLDLREHVAECSPYRVCERKVVIAGKTVVEKDAGWFLEKTGERISSAPIRIEEVLNTSAGRGYYRGRVRLEGEEKPFPLQWRSPTSTGGACCIASATSCAPPVRFPAILDRLRRRRLLRSFAAAPRGERPGAGPGCTRLHDAVGTGCLVRGPVGGQDPLGGSGLRSAQPAGSRHGLPGGDRAGRPRRQDGRPGGSQGAGVPPSQPQGETPS